MAHPSPPTDETQYGHHGAKPRPDDTPPRNRVIFSYTTLAAITLVGLSFLFDSYMDISRRGRRGQNLEESRSSVVLAEYQEAQRGRLARGAMPIERAMAELARQDRRAFPLILPAPSEDEGALDGWAQLPRRAPAAPEEAAVPPATEPLPQGTLPSDVTLEQPTEGAPTEAAPTEAAPTDGAAPSEAAPTEGAPATGGSIAPGAITPTPAAPAAARRRAPAAEPGAAEPTPPPAE